MSGGARYGTVMLVGNPSAGAHEKHTLSERPRVGMSALGPRQESTVRPVREDQRTVAHAMKSLHPDPHQVRSLAALLQ